MLPDFVFINHWTLHKNKLFSQVPIFDILVISLLTVAQFIGYCYAIIKQNLKLFIGIGGDDERDSNYLS